MFLYAILNDSRKLTQLIIKQTLKKHSAESDDGIIDRSKIRKV